MAPLPKRKYAKARQGKRRSHLHRTPPALTPCPQCHTLRPPHQMCPRCGFYKGREVVAPKAAKKRGG